MNTNFSDHPEISFWEEESFPPGSLKLKSITNKKHFTMEGYEVNIEMVYDPSCLKQLKKILDGVDNIILYQLFTTRSPRGKIWKKIGSANNIIFVEPNQ